MNATETGTSLPSEAEKNAKRAEALPAFGGLNLGHIRRQVSQLLGLIGRDGVFDEYTTHDISHIDKMLASLDWLVPDQTKKVMSPADWLMTTLAIYFHDLGMLVTKREFDSRYSTDFATFRDNVLYAGPNGKDYKAKVSQLQTDRAERFLYQDFVRHKHAERVRAWVSGDPRPELGITTEVARSIAALLEPLGEQFRRDLGLICESHHLNDLDNLQKYKVSQPYGDSDEATANLQYCAVLLRSADLLHMTSDRTPSIAFNVINPTDPISQQEWAKQAAVTRVRSRVSVNSDGIADESLPRDTIEVHAYFANPDGFFGLTSYIAYTTSQLKQSHDWISATLRQGKSKHDFPWKRVDDTHVETKGFLRESFEFSIDQAKILDLLTGHTLYNDTRVVLRELVQNSIDAIRLHYHPGPPTSGSVEIAWNSASRTLHVRDNGTGMSQEVISNFLLRVGSSRYQDPEFRKRYPHFSSISRFGIGVLSAFMIADSVEIRTVSPDDDEARMLTLRSVHGRYLIQTLRKSDERFQEIGSHGTDIRLALRASVKISDILETARLWVVVPGCRVTVKVDDKPSIEVGFQSPAEALKAALSSIGVDAEIGQNAAPPDRKGRGNVRILERSEDGVTLAYAVRWSEYYQEWAFLPGPDRVNRDGMNLGTCIEGIRVDMGTPGFVGMPFYAIANVTGTSAPKTNVARSGMEATPERDRMLQKLYATYLGHVSREIEEMCTKRQFSLTWAAQEGRFLLQTFSTDRAYSRAVYPQLLEDAIANVRFLLVEHGGTRETISPSDLSRESNFWTVESAIVDWAEQLIKEVASSVSLGSLLKALNMSTYELPDSKILCGVRPSEPAAAYALSKREVSMIVIHRGQRRADLQWTDRLDTPRWLGLGDLPQDLRVASRIEQRRTSSRRTSDVLYCVGQVEVRNLTNETAVRAFDHLLVLADTPAAKFLAKARKAAIQEGSREAAAALGLVFSIVQECYRYGDRISDPESFVQRMFRRTDLEEFDTPKVEALIDVQGLCELVGTEHWIVFDPAAGRRKAPDFTDG